MKRINYLMKLFRKAKQIPFDDSTKIVLMSDCHRGDGSIADNFYKNQNLYIVALRHYYKENYTYIELGDGDELWGNKNFSKIFDVHSNIFESIQQFYKKDRYYAIWGNHDMVKGNPKWVRSNLSYYWMENREKIEPLFPGIKVHESLVLKHKETNEKILLLHGHQVDFLNNKMWRFSQFLVRYIWRPLVMLGIKDPTSAAKNPERKLAVEKKLIKWCNKEKKMMIAGHTHRSAFPKLGEPLYFNDGSCVQPRCITAIEIIHGEILLVKWNIKVKKDGVLFVSKDVLEGPVKLDVFFNKPE